MSWNLYLIFVFGLVYFINAQVINSQQNSTTDSSKKKNQVLLISKATKNENWKGSGKNQSEMLLAQPQHFVPMMQFYNGPFVQHFQPVNANKGFRHNPHPFINSGFTHNNRFFHVGPNRGFNQLLSNNLQIRPTQLVRPAVHNRPNHQRPFFNQEVVNSDSQFHSNGQVMNDHSEAASNHLLGSGNFNVLKGGIFADPENPPLHYREHHRPTTNADFFQGFKDFQPFSNALSVTHNRHWRRAQEALKPF